MTQSEDNGIFNKIQSRILHYVDDTKLCPAVVSSQKIGWKITEGHWKHLWVDGRYILEAFRTATVGLLQRGSGEKSFHRRNFTCQKFRFDNLPVLATLHRSLVPILEFGHGTILTLYNKDVDTLKRVKRRASKFLAHGPLVHAYLT